MKIRKIAPNEDLETTVNKKRNRYKIAIIAVIFISAAGFLGFKYFNPKKEAVCLGTDTKIYDTYKNAVVLVKHKYGYFAKINGKEIPLNVEDAKEETIYGTGFFVDTEGDMITNRHVLQPWNSTEEESEKVNTMKVLLATTGHMLQSRMMKVKERENTKNRAKKLVSQRVKNLLVLMKQKQIHRKYQLI
jgi:hypothetical protein